MKDIVIKVSRIKKEFWLFVLCVAAAFFVNVYAIIKFDTPWIELLTCFHVVVGLSILFYAVLVVLRSLLRLLRNLLLSK